MSEPLDSNKLDFELMRSRPATPTRPSTPSSGASTQSSGAQQNLWPLRLSANFVRHYIIGETIGAGSYAQVRECVDTRTLERLAVKIVNKEQLRRRAAKALANQMQEIRLLRRLRHPNIIVMRECLHINSFLYITLEYCSLSLAQLLAQQPNSRLELGLCSHLLRHICSGLSYLHSSGIVHFDVKPQNMLMTNNGTLKLIDFGVSQLVSLWQRSASSLNNEGSPLFQAPELLAAKQSIDDCFKVDVWSCGITLYLMIFGQYPFMNEALLGLCKQILTQAYSIPSWPATNASLRDLIAIMLEKDPSKRATVDQLLEHAWLKLGQALGSSNEEEDCEFVDLMLARAQPDSEQPDADSDEALKPRRDVYKSMSVLPYLYRHHYPNLQILKTSNKTTQPAQARDKNEPNKAEQESSQNLDLDDTQIEWGTKEQYKLIKLPQVRANRLKPGSRCGRRQRIRLRQRRNEQSNEISKQDRRLHRHPKRTNLFE